MAAAEALGALAGLFGAAPPSEAGVPSAAPASSGPTAVPLEAKAGKKRRSKTAAPGEDGAAEGTPKGRGRQPTSSYWSVAERSEFLRALVVHGPRWDVVSSTLAQKSAAQARNYFARNESEPDFAEAAALARSHAELPVSEREEAALTFVRQRFANNAAATAASAAPNAATNMAGGGAGLNGDVPRTTHLPPPPGIVTSQADGMDVKMREGSPEVLVQRRGLQINSLLNDTSDTHVKRRSSLHEWQEQREVAHAGGGQRSVGAACSVRATAVRAGASAGHSRGAAPAQLGRSSWAGRCGVAAACVRARGQRRLSLVGVRGAVRSSPSTFAFAGLQRDGAAAAPG